MSFVVRLVRLLDGTVATTVATPATVTRQSSTACITSEAAAPTAPTAPAASITSPSITCTPQVVVDPGHVLPPTQAQYERGPRKKHKRRTRPAPADPSEKISPALRCCSTREGGNALRKQQGTTAVTREQSSSSVHEASGAQKRAGSAPYSASLRSSREGAIVL